MSTATFTASGRKKSKTKSRPGETAPGGEAVFAGRRKPDSPEGTERSIQAYGPGFNRQAGNGQESGSVHSSRKGGCRFFVSQEIPLDFP